MQATEQLPIFQISLRYNMGCTVEAEAMKVMSVADLKRRIQDRTNISHEVQCLEYNDLSLRHERSAFPIYVKYLSGLTITINVEPSDTIGKVKEKIRDMQNLPVSQQRCLVFATQVLQDDCTVQHYSIGKDATLHLILRLRGEESP